MSSRDAFTSAMRALAAMDEPLQRWIADSLLCLFCWDALHSAEELPPAVREWLGESKALIARAGESGALSYRIRRWAESLDPAEAREVAHRFVDAFADVVASGRD